MEPQHLERKAFDRIWVDRCTQLVAGWGLTLVKQLQDGLQTAANFLAMELGMEQNRKLPCAAREADLKNLFAGALGAPMEIKKTVVQSSDLKSKLKTRIS